MGALLLLLGLVVVAGGSDDDNDHGRRTPPGKPATWSGSGSPVLPGWVPTSAMMASAPPPEADGHPIVSVGGWYWADERNMPGPDFDGVPVDHNGNPKAPGKPRPVLLTRIAPPPKGATILLVRVWMRVDRNDVTEGGAWDLSGELTTPLVVSDQKVRASSLIPGRPPVPMDFDLTRNADGSIDVEAANLNRLAGFFAMALEFAFRA